MIELDQSPGNYYLRFATYPNGDMQQVLEGQAIVSYDVSGFKVSNPTSLLLTHCIDHWKRYTGYLG